MPAEGDQHRNWSAMSTTNSNSQWSNSWNSAETKAIQDRLNRLLGPEYISKRPGAGGGKVHYLEGWKAINLANEVFGFNGWSTEIRNISTDHREQTKEGKYILVMSVTIRVTLRDGTFHEDVGSGHIENVRSWHAAFDKCRKEATTDALKRCLRSFGPLLGNCLYDSEYIKQISTLNRPSRPQLEPQDLYRAPEFRPQNDRSNMGPARSEPSVGPQTPMSRSNQIGEFRNNSRSMVTSTYTKGVLNEKSNLKLTTDRSTNIRGERNNTRGASRPETNQDHANSERRLGTNGGDDSDMEYGSDFLEDFNEEDIDAFNVPSEDLVDYESFDGGELVTFDDHAGNDSRNTIRPDTSIREEQTLASSAPQLGLQGSIHKDQLRSQPLSAETAEVTNGPILSQDSIPQTGLNQTGLQSTNRNTPVAFFSARVAEEVQKDQPVDSTALFDPSFQSPSIRKTIDHSTSRPIYKPNVTSTPVSTHVAHSGPSNQVQGSPALSNRIHPVTPGQAPKIFDNPRLNPVRMVGMPPAGGSGRGAQKRAVGSAFPAPSDAATTGPCVSTPTARGEGVTADRNPLAESANWSNRIDQGYVEADYGTELKKAKV
ncbi:uncharacterized protein V1516DRAFT_675819 [Lipomyces oligophaga]|uniref:uncharacterized protein n=1 Tax=Lipomyces oligophaga TaxID=45792 RepID=UPI0034CE3649